MSGWSESWHSSYHQFHTIRYCSIQGRSACIKASSGRWDPENSGIHDRHPVVRTRKPSPTIPYVPADWITDQRKKRNKVRTKGGERESQPSVFETSTGSSFPDVYVSCDCGSSIIDHPHRNNTIHPPSIHHPSTHRLNTRSCSAWRRQPVVIHHARCSSRRREASGTGALGAACVRSERFSSS